MAISLTSHFRTAILIIIIIFASINRCRSHPRLTLNLKNKKSIVAKKPTIKKNNNLHPKSSSRFDNLSTDIISQVIAIPNPPAFLANISIGDPPVPQLLLIDTGSDLTWIQCVPCKCYSQTSPFFQPSRSSTYRNASCESAPHAMPQIRRDQTTKTCRYYLRYRDFSSTEGILAQEKLTFQTSKHGLVSKPNVLLGCGQNNTGFSQYSGVLGLGPGKFSIVNRYFGSKFSYCFGSLTGQKNPHNILALGHGSKHKGNQTPLQVFQDRYYLDLQAISFGTKLLEIEPDLFKRDQSRGGTILDTGCSPTILVREAYETLTEEIDFYLGETLRRVNNWEQYTNFCYEGNIQEDLFGFPAVTFHFAGDAELILGVESLFMNNENGDRFCLGMNMNMYDDINVIGAMAQQKYNVGYDLKAMKVYFHRTERCDDS